MKRFHYFLPILCLLYVSFTGCEPESILEASPTQAETESSLPAVTHADFKHTVRIPIRSSDGQSELVLDVSFNDDDLLDMYQPENFEIVPRLERDDFEINSEQVEGVGNPATGNEESDGEETELYISVVEAKYADGVKGMDLQFSAMARQRAHLYGYTYIGQWYNTTFRVGHRNGYWTARTTNYKWFFVSDRYHHNKWTNFHSTPIGSNLSIRTQRATVLVSYWRWF
ncbi:MAG: hypothetical protein AAFR61_05220 [Bacteroidota bacterium]